VATHQNISTEYAFMRTVHMTGLVLLKRVTRLFQIVQHYRSSKCFVAKETTRAADDKRSTCQQNSCLVWQGHQADIHLPDNSGYDQTGDRQMSVAMLKSTRCHTGSHCCWWNGHIKWQL